MVTTLMMAMVPPGALSRKYDSTRPARMSMSPMRIPMKSVLLNPCLNCMAEATGRTIREEMTRTPVILMETEMESPMSRAKI